jgi:hypothetical protein
MSDDRDALIEQYLNAPDDPEAATKAEQDLLPPRGWWRTVPPLTVTSQIREEEPNKGRFFVRYFGELRRTITRLNGEGVREEVQIWTRQGFGMSPVRVNRRDRSGNDLGTPDAQHALYLSARRAYRDAYGNDPEAIKDVVEFIANYPVEVNLIHVGVPTEANPAPDREPSAWIAQLRSVREE